MTPKSAAPPRAVVAQQLAWVESSGRGCHRATVCAAHEDEQQFRDTNNNAPRLRLILLQGYCPELNPDESLKHDVKTNALGKSRPVNKSEMIKSVRSHLHRRQKQPELIGNLFKKKHVQYAA